MSNQYKPTTPRSIIFPVGPSIAYVALTQDQFALIDLEDADTLRNFSWYASWNIRTKSYYAFRTTPDKKNFSIHRTLSQTPKGMVTDHINHNTLDNRRCNMRHVTVSENNFNHSHTSGTAVRIIPGSRINSGRGGTCLIGGKWKARWRENKKVISKGGFTTKEEAEMFLDQRLQKENNPNQKG